MTRRALLLAMSLCTVFACVRRMIGYECAGLAGCNMAPRYSGTVTMAEWSSGEDLVFAKWRWDVTVKITEGKAHCSGTYRSTRTLRSQWRTVVSGSVKEPGKFNINADSSGYRGSVHCPPGKGTSTHTDYIKNRSWTEPVSGLDLPDIPIEGKTTDPNRVSGSFPDSIYRHDGAIPVYIRAKWELRGLSPCRDEDISSLPILLRPERTSQRWPYKVNSSLDGRQIAELKSRERRTARGNEGLTRTTLPQVALHTDTASTRQRDGYCYWVDSITVAFQPIEVYIDRSYSRASCEYQETLAHELRHVEAYERLFTRYGAKVLDTLVKTSKHYPTRQHALAVVSLAAAQQFNQIFGQSVEEAVTPSIDELRDSLKARNDELDTIEEYDAVHSRCDNWVP